MTAGIWVYLERSPEGISDTSVEAVIFADGLAKEIDAKVEGICVGGEAVGIQGLPGEISTVRHIAGDALEEYTTHVYGSAIESVVRRESPQAVIFPPTSQGEDLASWLGAAFQSGVLIGACRMRRENERFIATRLEFERKVAVDYGLFGQPVFIAVEGGVATASMEVAGAVSIMKEEAPGISDEKVRVIKTEVAKKTVNLREAKTIVAVGAGVGSQEGFQTAQELAEVLGGEIGATRAAVDAGWVTHDRQIGQTGVKVKPDLYVACGISGAAQHRVGMMDSGTIISINIDTQTAMSRYSHYVVEGDIKVVIPKIIEILRG